MRATARPTRVALTAAVVPLLVLAGAGVAVADHHSDPRQAHITARASEDVVAPGETVVLRGKLTRGARPAAGHRVKVQTGYVGHWETLRGARVRTDGQGRYRVRVVMHVTGVRDLRVVGMVPGPADEAFARVTLMVKRGA
jgi:hypothetical protein